MQRLPAPLCRFSLFFVFSIVQKKKLKWAVLEAWAPLCCKKKKVIVNKKKGPGPRTTLEEKKKISSYPISGYMKDKRVVAKKKKKGGVWEQMSNSDSGFVFVAFFFSLY